MMNGKIYNLAVSSMSDKLNRLPADLLIVLSHHLGELDAFFPLIFLLRKRNPRWRTRLLMTKKMMVRQVSQSPALLAMMSYLEIDYHLVPVNVTNEPAELFAPIEVRGGVFRRFLSRAVGRLISYFNAARSMPDFIRELRRHKRISVEGTQYPLLVSLTCLFAHIGKRTVFLHNHSLQPGVSAPRRKVNFFFGKPAKGIIFSDSESPLNLYGEKFYHRSYRTGLIKYRPEWTAFCRGRMANPELTILGIFAKRISFEVYRELLEDLLSRLAQAMWSHPVLIKPHPMDDQGLYDELIADYPSLDLALTFDPNFVLVPTLHAGICFPGSSIVDCDAFGVPSIELRPVAETYGPGKVIPTVYAKSGYLSTSEIDAVVVWLMSRGRNIRVARKNVDLSCGANELDVLLKVMLAPPA
jgi:hypothetical protein